MSVVACRKTPEKIYLAADSQLSCGGGKRPGLFFEKITKIGKIVVGSVGTCSEVVLFLNYIKSNKLPKSIAKLQLYMAEFYKWRDELNVKLNPEDKDALSNCRFMVITGGEAFCIENFFITHVIDFHAIGSGEDYAMGAMAHGANVREAVAIACKYNTDCGLPVQYMEIKR